MHGHGSKISNGSFIIVLKEDLIQIHGQSRKQPWDKICLNSPRPGGHINQTQKIQLCFLQTLKMSKENLSHLESLRVCARQAQKHQFSIELVLNYVCEMYLFELRLENYNLGMVRLI